MEHRIPSRTAHIFRGELSVAIAELRLGLIRSQRLGETRPLVDGLQEVVAQLLG
jgi:hypothetical protein